MEGTAGTTGAPAAGMTAAGMATAGGGMESELARARAPESTPTRESLLAEGRARAKSLASLQRKLPAMRLPDGTLPDPKAGATAMVAALGATASAATSVSAEHRLIHRLTLGYTQLEQAWVDALGYDGYLNRQLDFQKLDDGPLEDILHQFLPTLGLSPVELLLLYGDNQQVPVIELWVATLLRSILSPRQLYERMTIFWSDHFNINILNDLGPLLKPADHRDVIRRHALGTFPELLRASAHSPAMLTYLTNDTNHKDHPNENYARELMELHTMGVDGGYTQQDVREVARCFTGWRFKDFAAGLKTLTYHFDPKAHDKGSKVVLGQVIPAGGGKKDGDQVLEILATHPSTAHFISTKMLRWMWGYQPPERYVDRLSTTYKNTGGHIPSMLKVMMKRSWVEQAEPKLKRPYHLMTSAVRGLFAEADLGFLLASLFEAGHVPFTWQPPNGFPDSAGYWAGSVLPRWNFATRALGPAPGLRPGIDLPGPATAPNKVYRRMDWLLFNGALSAEARKQMIDFLKAGPPTQERIDQAVALVLSSPDFQEY